MDGRYTRGQVAGSRLTRSLAKHMLQQRGHSYRSAAQELGCSLRHLHAVLNGERQSARLLKRIVGILPRVAIPRNSPYRARAAG